MQNNNLINRTDRGAQIFPDLRKQSQVLNIFPFVTVPNQDLIGADVSDKNINKAIRKAKEL